MKNEQCEFLEVLINTNNYFESFLQTKNSEKKFKQDETKVSENEQRYESLRALIYKLIESLILAQDERWRRA